MDGARLLPKRDQHECPICSTENKYVLYDGDKMCVNCGHVPAVDSPTHTTDEWERWAEHRRSEYDGFYGEDRIKMVGGFAHAYEFTDDFDV